MGRSLAWNAPASATQIRVVYVHSRAPPAPNLFQIRLSVGRFRPMRRTDRPHGNPRCPSTLSAPRHPARLHSPPSPLLARHAPARVPPSHVRVWSRPDPSDTAPSPRKQCQLAQRRTTLAAGLARDALVGHNASERGRKGRGAARGRSERSLRHPPHAGVLRASARPGRRRRGMVRLKSGGVGAKEGWRAGKGKGSRVGKPIAISAREGADGDHVGQITYARLCTLIPRSPPTDSAAPSASLPSF